MTVVREASSVVDPLYPDRALRPGADGSIAITMGNSVTVDAFSRLRVSNPYNQFGAFNEYKINPFNYITATAGTGTATLSTTTKLVTLATGGTVANARAVIQSRAYMRYVPGRSQFVAQTSVFGTQPKAGCVKRVGYYEDRNGLFLQWDATGASFVRRSDVTGSIVDTAFPQTSWNIDKMDGTGPSQITLDLTKGQIFWLDFQYLGMGRVRFGFDIGGILITCHEVNHANLTDVQPYMATANLPLRWEILNTGTAAQAETMTMFCGKCDSEGGFELSSVQYSASNGVTAKNTSTTLIPLISLRPGPTFNGVTNRGWILPVDSEIFTTGTQTHYYQVIWNATLTGPSWTSVNANAMTQIDVTASAVSLGTGIVLEEGWIAAGGFKSSGGGGGNSTFNDRPLVNSFDGTTPDTVTIAIQTLAGTGTALANINWHGYW